MSLTEMNEEAAIEASGLTETSLQTQTEIQQIPHHGYDHYYEDPSLWVGVAFVLVVLLLIKPVGKALGSLLYKRIEAIADRISEVKKLDKDSKKLLEEYEDKYKNAAKEADQILKKSAREIAQIKKERMEKLEQEMLIKQKEAENRIRQAQDEAVKEITELTSEMTIKALKIALAENLSSKTQDKLIEDSIENIKKAAG